MESRAKDFATRYHALIDHKRKYTGEPYITHPAAVVELVRSVPHTEAMICAAWLHDTVEDTPASLADIEKEFGAEVATLVEMLTDVSRSSDGKRSMRKAIDREHTSRASPAAKTIKLADLIDNTRSIVAHDPKFARVYLIEKALLLEVLREGDATLWSAAYKILLEQLEHVANELASCHEESEPVAEQLLPCPFCGGEPKVSERPDSNSENGGYMCFVACYCGGFSARAHQYGQGFTPRAARTKAADAWNHRAAGSITQAQKALEVLMAMAEMVANGSGLTIANDWGFGSATLIDEKGSHTHIGSDLHNDKQKNFDAFVDGLHDELIKGKGLSWVVAPVEASPSCPVGV